MSVLHNIDFDDLFQNKRQGVVCYLSLERRYMDLMKQYHICRDTLNLFSEADIRIAEEKRMKENN